MLVKIFGGAVYGINALTITIEVNILWGAKFIIVGLPDNAVKESQQRIDSALREIGLKIPGKRVIINMAPADVKKEGSAYDLPIAIGILAANEQLPTPQLDKYIIMGELSLDGSLQAVKGVLPIAIHAKKEGFKGILLPYQNANEAAVVQDFEVYGFHHLKEVIAFLKQEQSFSRVFRPGSHEIIPRQRPTRFQRCKRSGKCETGLGNRRCRGAQHDHDRFARLRENHVSPKTSHDSPTHDDRRGTGNDKNTFRRRENPKRSFVNHGPPLPLAASYHIGYSLDRWRFMAPTGRNLSGT